VSLVRPRVPARDETRERPGIWPDHRTRGKAGVSASGPRASISPVACRCWPGDVGGGGLGGLVPAVRAERVRGVAVAKTLAATKAGTCLAPTWRSSGHRRAAPPVRRTRSQSQTKQQAAGGHPALLPFVPNECLAGTAGTPASAEERARSPVWGSLISKQLPAERSPRPRPRSVRPRAWPEANAARPRAGGTHTGAWLTQRAAESKSALEHGDHAVTGVRAVLH